MKSQVYIIIILFLSLKVSAQEKESEQELNTYLEKSTTKTYVEKEVLYYKTSTEYALGYEGSKTKESPIIEFNLNKLIVYRKKYNVKKQSYELSLTFRDKDEIQKYGFKTITISFNKINSYEIDHIIKILKSYYIKK